MSSLIREVGSTELAYTSFSLPFISHTSLSITFCPASASIYPAISSSRVTSSCLSLFSVIGDRSNADRSLVREPSERRSILAGAFRGLEEHIERNSLSSIQPPDGEIL